MWQSGTASSSSRSPNSSTVRLEDVIREGIQADAALAGDRLKKASEILRFAESRYNYRLDEAIYEGIRAITKSTGPHEHCIWEAAAKWTQEGHFEFFLQSVEPHKIVAYLSCFGYPAATLLGAVGRRFVGWSDSDTCRWPQMSFEINGGSDSGGHEEYAGCTWYMVDIMLGPLPELAERKPGPFLLDDCEASGLRISENGDRHLAWRAPRRLVHLREALHDFIKRSLQLDAYNEYFGETPFARHGAPYGTTARLRAWLQKLASLINQQSASPEIVTRTIMFFRPPTHLRTCFPYSASAVNGSFNLHEAPLAAANGYPCLDASLPPANVDCGASEPWPDRSGVDAEPMIEEQRREGETTLEDQRRDADTLFSDPRIEADLSEGDEDPVCDDQRREI